MSAKKHLKNQAIILTAARLFEAVIQLLTPIVLVRYIDTNDFGLYRLFWLAINTIMVFAPLGMPSSLSYFLPKLDSKTGGKYVFQTIIFLILSACVSALILTPWNVFLPANLHSFLSQNNTTVPLFIFFWVFSILLDFLPNALQKNTQQAIIIVVLAIIKTALIIYSAIIFGDLDHILMALIVFVLIKSVLLIFYTFSNFNWIVFNKATFKLQLNYAMPFGLASAVYGLRRQTELWIVGYLFSSSVFGAFSLAAMVCLPFDILRSSVSNVVLPRMCLAYAKNDRLLTIEYNRRANVIVAATSFPLVVFIIFFATEIVDILFGKQYTEAIPVLRVYITQLLVTLEVGTLFNALAQGVFNFRYNLFVLIISAVLSFFLAQIIGLPGAAVGSVAANFIALLIGLFKISSVLKIPIRALQYWTHLCLLMITAWLSIIPVYFINDRYLTDYPLFIILPTCFLLLILFYLILLLGSGELKRIKKLFT